MPTRPRTRPGRGLATRAAYTRTNADLLVNDPDGFPSAYPPVHWLGLDSGGGSYPIGPNGPYPAGRGGIAAVTRAISLIVGPIASSPFKVVEAGFGGQPLPTPRWLTDPMLLRPDARFPGDFYPAVTKLSRSKFWADFISSALCHGLGAFLFQRDSFDQPAAGSLRLLHPGMLSTQRDADGSLHWVVGDDGLTAASDLAVFDRDGVLALGGFEYQLCVLRNPASPVDAEGMSQGVFAMNPGAFGLAGQVDAYAAGTFRSGVPAGYLKVSTPGLVQAQADELKAAWMRNHGNDRRSIAVLNSTTDFTPLSLSPVDAALAEMKTVSRADIAFAFGLDPVLLSAAMSGSLTYGNVRDFFRQYKDLSLGFWISALQDVLSALLPGLAGVQVDTDAFTRPDAQERYAGYAVAISSGVLTVNEARELEGLPPLPEPKQPPQLVAPVAPVEQPPASDQPGQPPPPPAELDSARSRRVQPWRGSMSDVRH